MHSNTGETVKEPMEVETSVPPKSFFA